MNPKCARQLGHRPVTLTAASATFALNAAPCNADADVLQPVDAVGHPGTGPSVVQLQPIHPI